MKKNKEWLKEELMGLKFRINEIGKVRLREVFELVDQLDEPEKIVIPQFVADYIEKWEHEGLTIYEWFTFDDSDVDEDVNKWLYDNDYEENTTREHLLIDAFRYGYEVEKEKKYYVKIQSQFLCVGKHIKDFIALQYHEDINDAEKYEFTEQEIKAIDERFWAFAQEVTE